MTESYISKSIQSIKYYTKQNHIVLISYIVILIGIGLRLQVYTLNRSLWLDEAMLALNIVGRSFSELFLPLDYDQGAPILFLIIEKFFLNLLGYNEFSLRLFPLISGLASIILIYKTIGLFTNKYSALIGTILFSLSNYLIYYSSEIKQYSSDIAITAFLYFFYKQYIEKSGYSLPKILIFGALSSFLIWISHPSVFVMAAILVSITLHLMKYKRWKSICYTGLCALGIGISFLTFYIISLDDLINHNSFHLWSAAFIPTDLLSLTNFKTTAINFFIFFKMPISSPLIGIVALSFIIGFVYLFRQNKIETLALSLPFAFLVFASAVKMYPFANRLLLFLTPCLLIFIAEGARQIIQASWKSYPPIAIAFIVLLFVPPAYNTIHRMGTTQFQREEIKPILSFINAKRLPGDVIYLHNPAQPAFEFYKSLYNFSDTSYILGTDTEAGGTNFITDIEKLRGKERVWFIFSHLHFSMNAYNDLFNEEEIFVAHLDEAGKQLDVKRAHGAVVYLYDLSDIQVVKH